MVRREIASALIVLGTLFASAWAAELPAPRFEPPPRLAITAAEFAKIRASASFEATKAEAVKAADALLEKPVELPDGYGSWIYYYANPKNGHKLQPLSLTEHKDPSTGEIFTDERTVAAYRTVLHYALEKAALTLGWASLYTGEDKYAAEVRRILLKLASDYSSYPGRLDRWGMRGFLAPLGGRRYVQALDEATGATYLTKAYDLTRGSSVYSDDDRAKIENDFFRATAATLLRFNQDIGNHQTWYDAGLMCIASVLADEALVEKVLTMRGGFFDQLDRSIGADGLWCEGTLAYHGYALSAMIEEVDAARRLGLPLQNEAKFKLLFTAPLHVTYPDGSLPAINDSDPGNVRSFDRAWKWAWETYRDPFFAQALANGNEKVLRALLEPCAAPAELSKAEWPPKMVSEDLSDAGLAVLRLGAGEQAVCVFMDYGPHGGAHGHFDKLNLLLFANGREWLLDPGRLNYSHKEYSTWVKTTAAHNTVALGGRSQHPTTGKLLYLHEGNGFAAAVAESEGAYPSSRLRRHLLLTPRFLVDIFDVNASRSEQIDLLAHAAASSLELVTPGLPKAKSGTAGTTDGYPHLTDVMSRAVDGDSQWDYLAGKVKLRVHLLGEPGEQLLACHGIGYTLAQKTPTLIRRRNGQTTRFIAVYDLSGDGGGITRVSRVPGVSFGTSLGAPAVVIETPEGTFQVEFGEKSVAFRRAD